MLDVKIMGWLLAMLGRARQIPSMASDSALGKRLGDDRHPLVVTECNHCIVAAKYLAVIKKIVGRKFSAFTCLPVVR